MLIKLQIAPSEYKYVLQKIILNLMIHKLKLKYKIVKFVCIKWQVFVWRDLLSQI